MFEAQKHSNWWIFRVKVKKEPKIRMDGICSRSSKINRIDWGPNYSLIQKELNGKGRSGELNFSGQTAGDGNLFFVQIFLEITKAVLYFVHRK
jgi:hypothetical protein